MRNWHSRELRNYTNVNGQIGILPRYYKDKIFDKAAKAELADIAAWSGIEKYRDDLRKLSRFHQDPEYYYNERLRHAHDKVKTSKQKM